MFSHLNFGSLRITLLKSLTDSQMLSSRSLQPIRKTDHQVVYTIYLVSICIYHHHEPVVPTALFN